MAKIFLNHFLSNINFIKKKKARDTIFQVVLTSVLGDTKVSPFTVGLTYLFYHTCRSKHLIAVFNRLKLGTSYESMERVDTFLTQRITTEASGHRVPVSRSSHPEVFLRKLLPKLICNFIEITLLYGCSPVNLLHIFRAPFTKNTSGRLLLSFITNHCQ